MQREAIALTQATYDRFDRAAKHSEQRFRDAGPPSRMLASDGAQVIRLRVISGTVTADGYPAIVQHTTDNGATWSDYDANYVRLESATGATLTVGNHYRAIAVGVNASGEVCYHVLSDLAATWETISFISSACPRYDACNNIVGYTFQHTTKRVLVDSGFTSEVTCTTGDDDCCPTVTLDCCETTMPRCIDVVFSNGTGYWACLNGVTVTMEWNETHGYYLSSPAVQVVPACDDGVTANREMLVSALWRACTTGVINVTINWCPETGGGCSPCLSFSEAHPGEAGAECEDLLGYTFTGVAINCGDGDSPSGEGSGGTVDITFQTGDCGGIAWPTPDWNCDGSDTGGGSGACTTEDLYVVVDGTTDFLGLSDIYSLVYDPTAIDTLFSGVSDYDGRFQWLCQMHDTYSGTGSPYLLFGYLAGTYYFGFTGPSMGYPFDRAADGCFSALTIHNGGASAIEWYSVAAANVACGDGGIFAADLAISGVGGGDCDGNITFTVSS